MHRIIQVSKEIEQIVQKNFFEEIFTNPHQKGAKKSVLEK